VERLSRKEKNAKGGKEGEDLSFSVQTGKEGLSPLEIARKLEKEKKKGRNAHSSKSPEESAQKGPISFYGLVEEWRAFYYSSNYGSLPLPHRGENPSSRNHRRKKK